MATTADYFAQAVRFHQAGQLPEAEQLYRQILTFDPRHAASLHLLGVIAHQFGRNEAAIELIRQAIGLQDRQPSFHSNLGEAHRALQQHAEAAACYQRAIELAPDFVPAHHNLGLLLQATGQWARAEKEYRTVIGLQTNHAEAHNNLGNVLRAQGKPSEAADSYRAALEHRPGYSEALNNLGAALVDLKQYAQAVESLRLSLELNPDSAEALHNLGNAYKGLRQPDESISSFQAALRVRPDFVEARLNLGMALQERGDFFAAADCFEQILSKDPGQVEALNNLGSVYPRLDRVQDAETSLRRAIQLRPDFAEAHNNLGMVLEKLVRLEDAQRSLEQAIRLEPRNAKFHADLGLLLRNRAQPTAAIQSYDEALRLDPDDAEAQCGRGEALLSLGDWAAGWAGHEYRLKCSTFDSTLHLTEPLWDGSTLDSQTLLVHAEQGLGDTLQFIRYVKLAQERVKNIVVAVHPSLLTLLTNSGFSNLVPERPPLPPFDVQVPLMSLPHLFGTRPESVPWDGPYLSADAERIEKWREVLSPIEGLKVGIIWQGNPAYHRDHARSIPLACFEALARVPGVNLISLQKPPGTCQILQVADRFSVITLDGLDTEGGAFLDTAAVLKNLDLVITPDTAVGHLAGGLGVPVWLALCHAPECRWLLDRNDCVWYPSTRLFRQVQPGDWQKVFERMAAELRARSSRQGEARSHLKTLGGGRP